MKKYMNIKAQGHNSRAGSLSVRKRSYAESRDFHNVKLKGRIPMARSLSTLRKPESYETVQEKDMNYNNVYRTQYQSQARPQLNTIRNSGIKLI